MKKITLLAVAAEEDSVLESLRSLGVMQVGRFGAVSGASAAVNDRLLSVRRVISALEKFAPETEDFSCSNGEKVYETASAHLEQLTARELELENISQRLKAIAMWGDFDRALLDELKEKGIRIVLCAGSQNVYEKISADPETKLCRLISSAGGKCYFAVVSEKGEDLPEIKLSPEDDPRKLSAAAEKINNGILALKEELFCDAGELQALRAYEKTVAAELEFERVRDSLDNHEKIVSLQGFVPVPAVEKLRSRAAREGWGLLITDPDASDDVPVLLEYNRFTRWIKPLFDFLGINPGYNELDVSGGVLVFFTIFYAMIVGDAGYGCLFLAASGAGMYLLRRKPAARLPLRLFFLLSVFTVIWGALCGSWFGVTWGGIPALSNASVKDANIQAFCFLLAVAQLTMGRIWSSLRSKNFRKVMADLGWILILWGNFFLTLRIIVWQGEFPLFMYWLFGTGLALVVLFGVNWRDVADVFQFPFAIINSFTDILSYIRLFAVGMSGACIAASFNGMAMDVAKASPWFIIFSVLILIAGHVLNLVMAMMGVLVHAVRLNTLEFSNHTGLTWSGKQFRPFAKQDTEE
ncbi:MAG: hypothetical protein IKC65_05765 [Lentisphaeria bacterium]|nr:hypothetical protein [Lentisphaeria bacterium]